ncbi:hypothetical protein P879_10769 [Paragonimus westermani]|uniref:C3H1-type domain-containing protein n=1 Tax=Paragonimus westermani TaxID=34504 RepID=A0A8T0DBC9_9TREM|nr:hypothetical protein P879_10769 [Paragonimus westermani]
MSGLRGNPYKWVSSSSVGRKKHSTRFKYVKKTNDIHNKYVSPPATSVDTVKNSVRNVDNCGDQSMNRTAYKSTWFQYHSLSRRRIPVRQIVSSQPNVGFPAFKLVRSRGVTPARTVYNNSSRQGRLEQKSFGQSYDSTFTRGPVRTAVKPNKLASGPHPGNNTRSRNTFRLVTRYSVRRIKTESRPSSGLNAVSKQRLQKAISCLRFRRRPICMFFVKTGKCCLGTRCRYEHDPNYLRICPRYVFHLRHIFICLVFKLTC